MYLQSTLLCVHVQDFMDKGIQHVSQGKDTKFTTTTGRNILTTVSLVDPSGNRGGVVGGGGGGVKGTIAVP